jgi:hypothetical protein
MGTAYIGLRKLWPAGRERLESLPRMLTEHWRAAATLRPRLFWQGRATWLRARPLTARITSERVAEDSSGRPQDRHPC